MSIIMPDQIESNRLMSSLSVLRPRIDEITSEFCRLLEFANPTLRLKFPSNERVIAVGIEEIIGTVSDQDDARSVMERYASIAQSVGIDETNLPVLLASIQTAMAETAGYTWTDGQEDAWTCWFDVLAEFAIRSSVHGDTQAA